MIKSEIFKLFKCKINLLLVLFFVTFSVLGSVFYIKTYSKVACIDSPSLKNFAVLLALENIGYMIYSMSLAFFDYKAELQANNFQNIMLSGSKNNIIIIKVVVKVLVLLASVLVNVALLLMLNLLSLNAAWHLFLLLAISVIVFVLFQNIVLTYFGEIAAFLDVAISMMLLVFVSNMAFNLTWTMIPAVYGYSIYQRNYQLSLVEMILAVFVIFMLIYFNYRAINRRMNISKES